MFDWYQDMNPQFKPDFYIYRLIEILLPRAMCEKIKKNPKDIKSQAPKLKMVELWAQNDKPRKGWLKVIGLNQ